MNIKEKLYQHCLDFAKAQREGIQNGLLSLNDALQDSNKSTAGDKHETGRAMAQLEQERLSKQLAENKKLFDLLHKIKPETPSQKVSLGALVTCSNGIFYLSIGLGKIDIDGNTFFAIALHSPLAQAMLQCHEQSFMFNGQNIEILRIE